MRKILHCAVIASSLSAGTAFAQSSVTLYGLLDTGFTYINKSGVGSQVAAQSSDYFGDRFGFRGNEDLGSGMSALFVLENGFDPTNGKFTQNGRMFGRQAYVGLSSRYGTVTLGRQYDFMVSMVGGTSASQRFAGYIGARPGDIDADDGAYRNNNSVKYTGTYGNTTFGAMYAFGGVAGSIAQGSMYGAGVKYARGPLLLGAAFSEYRNPAQSIYDGTSPAANGAYTNPLTSPINSGFSSAQRQQIFSSGASYMIGKLTIGATYSNIIYHNIIPTSSTVGYGSARFNAFEVTTDYQFAPDIRAGVAYSYTKSETARYNQVDTGLVYSLSKRTSLYGAVIYQHASGRDSTGKLAVAQVTLMSPSSTPSQVVVHAGIIHLF